MPSWHLRHNTTFAIYPYHMPQCGITTKTGSQGCNRTWDSGSFCHDFIENTFQEKIPVCNHTMVSANDQMGCFRSPHSVHMATYTIRNIVLDPYELYRSLVDPDRAGIRHSNSTWLLESDEEVSYKMPTMNGLADTMEDGDYVRLYVDELIAGQRLKSTVCDQWIQELTFLFVSHDFHIYFRFWRGITCLRVCKITTWREANLGFIELLVGINIFLKTLKNNCFLNFKLLTSFQQV